MRYNGMDDMEIAQALKDAHCDTDTIAEFLRLKALGRHDQAIRLLTCYRCRLVRIMHEAQKPVDILDYLIYRFQKS